LLTIIPVKGIPDIESGDNLGEIIVAKVRDQGEEFRSGDVTVVSQKVVSKAEGRVVNLSRVTPSPFAAFVAKEAGKDPRQVEVILRETRKIIRMKAGHLITETRHGFICANAGVDASNVAKGKDTVTLLPMDPDASASRISNTIRKLTGKVAPVIITDTFGRAWRMGQVNFAIGISGMKPIQDYRGTRDMYRHTLHVTEIAIADELASAGELVMNKVDRVPVALVRGYETRRGKGTSKDLLRPEDLDLFR
jgi:coenzyme F420-0:L-glutamate ligase / coenzyme F420-1:gamma-L-glutamate ligase